VGQTLQCCVTRPPPHRSEEVYKEFTVFLSTRSVDVNKLIPDAPARAGPSSAAPAVVHHRVVRHERFRNVTPAQARAILEPLEVRARGCRLCVALAPDWMYTRVGVCVCVGVGGWVCAPMQAPVCTCIRIHHRRTRCCVPPARPRDSDVN
jgi:hypothetical protein